VISKKFTHLHFSDLVQGSKSHPAAFLTHRINPARQPLGSCRTAPHRTASSRAVHQPHILNRREAQSGIP
jgi:hypothetical protein